MASRVVTRTRKARGSSTAEWSTPDQRSQVSCTASSASVTLPRTRYATESSKPRCSSKTRAGSGVRSTEVPSLTLPPYRSVASVGVSHAYKTRRYSGSVTSGSGSHGPTYRSRRTLAEDNIFRDRLVTTLADHAGGESMRRQSALSHRRNASCTHVLGVGRRAAGTPARTAGDAATRTPPSTARHSSTPLHPTKLRPGQRDHVGSRRAWMAPYSKPWVSSKVPTTSHAARRRGRCVS